ncbi:MAG: signal peptidase II [Pseudomonadota bacterium]
MRLGLSLAAVVLVLDQLSKYWILAVYDLPAKGSVEILPFFSLTMVWNRGISLGLMQAGSDGARWLLVGVTLAVTMLLLFWLRTARQGMLRFGLGLVIGGAIGNIVDRIRFGAVADFVHLHGWGHDFYVFNIADSAITIGVGLLLVEAMLKPGSKSEEQSVTTTKGDA